MTSSQALPPSGSLPTATPTNDVGDLGPIKRADPLLYYVQLAAILRGDISAGRYRPGDSLPSEAELGANYGISRTAIRQALSTLVAEGLVQKEKGRGTFVRATPVADFVVQELRGFYDEMTDKGHAVATTIIGQEVVPLPAAVAGELRVRMGAEGLRIFRVRSVDGVPICEVETFLPLPRFAGLSSIDLSKRSLYSVLGSEFGIMVAGGRRHIESASASETTAANLGIAPGDHLLRLTAVNYDQRREPFEFFNALYRGDSTRFELSVDTRESL